MKLPKRPRIHYPQPSPSPSSSPSATPKDEYGFIAPPPRRRPGLSWLKWPVFLCSGLVGAFLLYRAYGLYQVAFERFGLTGIQGVCSPLGFVPFLGGWLQTACDWLADFIVGTLALVALAALTTLQLLPTLLYFHPQTIATMVEQLRANQRSRSPLEPHQGDNTEVQKLVHRHNQMGDRALKTLLIFSVIAFGLEAWIIWIARAGNADLGPVLVDALALDLLIAATLAFGNAFQAKPTTARQYGS